jgi:FkbM family methyltransferase
MSKVMRAAARIKRDVTRFRSLNFFPKFIKPRWYGLNELEKKLIEIIGTEPGFFVELGANDGLTQSNTKHLELFHGWHGVLIEPWFGNYKKLAAVRSPRTSKVHAACVGFDFKDKEVKLAFSNLMTAPLGLESDLIDPEAHAASGRDHLVGGEHLQTFTSPARTLTEILESANAPKLMDLLSLDVEGAELAVLKGLDHNNFRFKWILVESRDFETMQSYLFAENYTFKTKINHHDYLFRDGKNLT